MQVLLDGAEHELTDGADTTMGNVGAATVSVEPDDRLGEPAEDNDLDQDVALDCQQFKRYKSLSMLQQYHDLG